jgi:hypothetical protein
VKWASAIGMLRLLVAALAAVALVGRYLYGLDFVTFSVGNYLGYLTHQSNFAAVVMFTAGGVTMLRGIREPDWASAGRMLITSYLTVAGIVFGLLAAQASERDYRLDVPWSDQLLHFWIPGLALADWLLAPGRHRVSWRFSALVLGYPLVWGIITMVRGSIVGWYPYFFLDPYQVASIGEFAGYSVAALALFSGIATLLNLGARAVPPIGEAPAVISSRSPRTGPDSGEPPRPPRRRPVPPVLRPLLQRRVRPARDDRSAARD